MTKLKMQDTQKAFLCFGVAAVMILGGVLAMGGFLAYAAEAENGVAHSEEITISDMPLSDGAKGLDSLNVLIYDKGQAMPENAISAQYALTAASEIAERVYDKSFSGRVFCNFVNQTSVAMGEAAPENPFWSVTAEVEGGQVITLIDAITGQDTTSTYYDGTTDWQWFDTWTDDSAEQLEGTEANFDEGSFAQPSAEETAELMKAKRAEAEEFAATLKSSPFAAEAVAIANDRGLGDSAQAVEGKVCMEGCVSSGEQIIEVYTVEVQLDDGTYLFLELEKDTMNLVGYDRANASYFDFMYGSVN